MIFADAANRAVTEVKKWATVEVPKKTGQLMQSHIVSPATTYSMKSEVYTEKEYAVPVHEGHRIVAWGRSTGRMQPPNQWMERAAARADGAIQKIFDDAAERVATKLTS